MVEWSDLRAGDHSMIHVPSTHENVGRFPVWALRRAERTSAEMENAQGAASKRGRGSTAGHEHATRTRGEQK